jgi:PKD repeat protein
MNRRNLRARRPACAPRRPVLEQLERRDLLSIGLNVFQAPALGRAGVALAFSARASDPSGAPLTYSWSFGDGATASGVDLTDLTHAYAAASSAPYTVSLTVSNGTDSVGDSSVVAVVDRPPTVDLGTDQTVRAGDVVSFNAAVADPAGPSDIVSVRWDFHYDGATFRPDASADGETRTTQNYATPGTYHVAVQAVDQGGDVVRATTDVVVKPADAVLVDPVPDRTVTVGEAVTLSGSYSDPGQGASADVIAWDTNYDGQTFHPVLTGSLTPTTTFSTPGTYRVALQVTDPDGDFDLEVGTVTVATYSGPTVVAGADQTVHVGDAVSFSGSCTDPDGAVSLNDVDWDFHYDGGNFHPEASGTLTPTETYTAPGRYLVALRATDSHGLTSLGTLNVEVDAVPVSVGAGAVPPANVGGSAMFSTSLAALTAGFGPSGGGTEIAANTPFVFTSVTGGSQADRAAGFTYYVSVDGGAYLSSASPSVMVPGLTDGAHEATGFVQGQDGAVSPVYRTTVEVVGAQVFVENTGTGEILVSWTGGSATQVDPGAAFGIAGTAPGLSITLLTAGADYQLITNGSIEQVSAASGVQGFSLSVDTTDFPGGSAAVGDGHIGTITLPAESTVSVHARGDLGSIVGPNTGGHTGVQALDLVFANLDGSITGLDHIDRLLASGWLGRDASQLVAVNEGVDVLSASGIGATVWTDLAGAGGAAA